MHVTTRGDGVGAEVAGTKRDGGEAISCRAAGDDVAATPPPLWVTRYRATKEPNGVLPSIAAIVKLHITTENPSHVPLHHDTLTGAALRRLTPLFYVTSSLPRIHLCIILFTVQQFTSEIAARLSPPSLSTLYLGSREPLTALERGCQIDLAIIAR